MYDTPRVSRYAREYARAVNARVCTCSCCRAKTAADADDEKKTSHPLRVTSPPPIVNPPDATDGGGDDDMPNPRLIITVMTIIVIKYRRGWPRRQFLRIASPPPGCTTMKTRSSFSGRAAVSGYTTTRPAPFAVARETPFATTSIYVYMCFFSTTRAGVKGGGGGGGRNFDGR